MQTPEIASADDPRQLRYLRTGLRALLWSGLVITPGFAALGMYATSIASGAAFFSILYVSRRLDVPRIRRYAADLATATIYVAVIGGCIEAGGIHSVLTPWWFTLPTIAALLGGTVTLRRWTAITLLTIGGMTFLFMSGLFPAHLTGNTDLIALLIGFSGALGSNLLLTAIFTRDVRNHRAEVRRSMAALKEEVDARSRAEDEARAAEEEARGALQVRSRFLALMSHEIRTPLHGVIGMNQLLQGTNLSASQQEYVSVALLAGRSLRHIVDQILDHARLDADKVTLELHSFSPAKLVEECQALFTQRANEAGLELRCDVGVEVPAWMEGDEHRIRQVLVNLLGNAIKFTPHGSISLHVGCRGGELIFQVSDTGIGVSAEAAARLFDPFAQADVGTNRRFGGTGLGLSICLDIVSLMDGTLTLDSEPGRGSTFTVSLPLALAESPIPTTEVAAPPVTRPLRVLLVEDNRVNQLLATRLLEGDGHFVMVAVNGREAVRMAKTEELDLILMDMHMPVMGGLEATGEIRRCGGWLGEIPIVALSASVLAEDRVACLDAGMDAFLQKPLDFAMFRQTLAEQATKRRPELVST